ncbi:MAG: tetratricopeptide repeat protein [Bacteroidia bacterium]
MKGARLRILLIAGTVLLSVLLYFAPGQLNRDKSAKAGESTGRSAEGFSAEELLSSAEASLDSSQKQNLVFLKDALKKNGDKDTASLDALGRFWDRNGIPAAAAIWFERKAEILKSEEAYLDAAYRYFDAFRAVNDTAVRSELVQKSIASYKKVLEINPKNLNAKTDLGACYADGTNEPMKGILLLREVVAEDPKHEMAQYNLGMLSVKSGQLDKAIERFKTVLEINPKRVEVNFYLGQVYLQKGDTAQAIQSYEQFIKTAPYDVSDVIKMVEKLKQPS